MGIQEEISENDEKILKKIKELIVLLPSSWVDILSAKMGKSKDSVFRYARGENVKRNGYHKEVLRLLKIEIAKELDRTNKLLDE